MLKLTIIIPTLNSERTIGRCISSVVSQSFTNIEILIIDGVSTDGTLAVLRSYNDARIKIYSEKDSGIYDAYNKGIQKSSGEWLYFLGSDDYLLEDDVLEKVFFADVGAYDVVYGDVKASHLAPENYGEWSDELLGFNRCHQAIFYRKRVFEVLGLYNIKFKVLADCDINHRWYFSKQLKNKYIPLEVAYFSKGGFSSTYAQQDEYGEHINYSILRLGHRRFSVDTCKYYTALAIRESKGQSLKYYLLKAYYFYLRVLKKISIVSMSFLYIV